MEIEKVMTVAAPAATVWSMLLDPVVMGGCVPGMQSIEVISDVEYVALIHVKISFVSAKFKLKTTIVEQRAPHYLRSEGTGEDASVASSLKQQSEIFLVELPGGQTELRIKVKVDMLGRLGTFGLTVMKTKADRMWDEFARNLVNRLGAPVPETGQMPVAAPAAMPQPVDALPDVADRLAGAPGLPLGIQVTTLATARVAQAQTWWARLLRGPIPDDRHIHIELQRRDTLLKVDWPLARADECAAWLREVLKQT